MSYFKTTGELNHEYIEKLINFEYHKLVAELFSNGNSILCWTPNDPEYLQK